MMFGIVIGHMVLGMIFGMLFGAAVGCRSASAFPLRLSPPRHLAARPPDGHEPPDLDTARTFEHSEEQLRARTLWALEDALQR